MKNINSLITKHGGLASHNDNSTTIFPFSLNLSPDKNDRLGLFAEYSGLRNARFFMKEKVEQEDLIVFNEINYFVVKSNEIQHQGNRVYSDVIAYEDDFIIDLSFTKQSLEGDIEKCNLPSYHGELPFLFAKGRLKSVLANDHIQYAFNQDDAITHIISVKYVESTYSNVKVGDSIKANGKNYEILTIEDLDDQKILLMFNCAKRLSTDPFLRIAPPDTGQVFGGGQTFDLNPTSEETSTEEATETVSETETEEAEARPAQSQTSGRKPKKPPRRKPKKEPVFPDIEL